MHIVQHAFSVLVWLAHALTMHTSMLTFPCAAGMQPCTDRVSCTLAVAYDDVMPTYDHMGSTDTHVEVLEDTNYFTPGAGDGLLPKGNAWHTVHADAALARVRS